MKMRVTDEGVLTPKVMLTGVDEVEIRNEEQSIVVTPTQAVPDPIFHLGKTPVDKDVSVGAARHDFYLYAISPRELQRPPGRSIPYTLYAASDGDCGKDATGNDAANSRTAGGPRSTFAPRRPATGNTTKPPHYSSSRAIV